VVKRQGWAWLAVRAAILLVVAVVVVALLALMSHHGRAEFNNIIGGNGE
jgi:ATP/ADP translocase